MLTNISPDNVALKQVNEFLVYNSLRYRNCVKPKPK